MSTKKMLPAGFGGLESFVEQWALPTTAERAQRRTNSTPLERQRFFDAAAPWLEEAMTYLDSKSLTELDEADRILLNLMFSLCHVQMAVEVHREMEPAHAMLRDAMIITRSITDVF